MKTGATNLSADFQRLYCDPAVFEQFSVLHPISLTRVLPFQADDPVTDHPHLLAAESAHLANSDAATRLAVVEAFGRSGLLTATDVAYLEPVIDLYDADFFEFMGEVYANAGMFICALRWHREFIAELETNRPQTVSDNETVYANAGYCLYSLGLHPETIAWSKSCIGPGQTADTVSRALINYEAQPLGGCVQGIERVATQTRYTADAFDPAQANQLTPRLKQAMEMFAPFIHSHVAWISSEATPPEILPEGYPFQPERDASPLTQHRMNLIFALCNQADALIARGYAAEAKRLLLEATLLEPYAEFIQDRLKVMP